MFTINGKNSQIYQKKFSVHFFLFPLINILTTFHRLMTIAINIIVSKSKTTLICQNFEATRIPIKI